MNLKKAKEAIERLPGGRLNPSFYDVKRAFINVIEALTEPDEGKRCPCYDIHPESEEPPIYFKCPLCGRQIGKDLEQPKFGDLARLDCGNLIILQSDQHRDNTFSCLVSNAQGNLLVMRDYKPSRFIKLQSNWHLKSFKEIFDKLTGDC